MSTISTTITSGITLGTSGYTSPLTIVGTGAVEASIGNGILGPATNAWTIDNQGTITAPNNGVRLLLGGYVDNAGGLIKGSTGVYITGTSGTTGTVTNSGTIIGTAGSGVSLLMGGYVDNTAGLIEGTYGVYITGTTGTVTNAGTIIGTAGRGIELKDGGSISNTGTIDGTIDGIDITGRAGTVTNSGTIAGTGHLREGIDFYAGGSVTNNTGGLIQGTGAGIYIGDIGATGSTTGTVINSSTIEGTGGAGVNLHVSLAGSVGNTGLIEGFGGVYVVTGAATVTNSGTITGAGGSYGGGGGVVFDAGGSVDNAAGLIQGHVFGVQIAGAAGTVTNSGTIVGTSNAGVLLQLGGSIGNSAGGLIQGYNRGAYVYGVAGTVANAGRIASTGTAGDGIRMKSGGLVSNSGTIAGQTSGVYIFGGIGTVVNSGTVEATGTAGVGIVLFAGGTVVNSGTISGAGGGRAIYIGGIGANLLVLGHGYQLSGGVYGGFNPTNTVQLAGSVGAALTVGYNGLGLTHFSDALFGTGGYDTLKVSNTSGTLPVTISGFTLTSDIVDLTAIGANGTITGTIGTQVTVTGSLGTETLQLDGSDSTNLTTAPDGSGGTDIMVACFCRGTLIRTETGEVAVQELAIGDRVVSLAGEVRPIRWIGRRAYDGRFIAGNRNVLPIRVTAGAIAKGVPGRDLWLSPEHSLYFDGVLAETKHLVNDATVVQAESVERIEYFHIELDTHDIIFAEGAAAESYVDDDNRMMFANAAEYLRLYPDDARPHGQFCLPRLEWGAEQLIAIRAALWRRAERLGYALDANPDLHLIVDGEILRPAEVIAETYRFAIPAGSRAVWLASHSVVPAEIDAGSPDFRRLGVPLERIFLSDGPLTIEAWHDHAGLSEGFHGEEATHRWTDGLARLPDALLRPFAGEVALEVHLTGNGLRYPVQRPHHRRASRGGGPHT